MRLLHSEYFKYVPTGGDLSTATERELIAGENVAIEMEGVQIEHIITTSPNPAEIHEAGSKIKSRCVLAAADSNDMVAVLGGTFLANVFTKTQTPRNLPQYDIRYRIATTLGTYVFVDITHVFFEPNWKGAFISGKRYYLGLDIKGSDLSVFTKDDSHE